MSKIVDNRKMGWNFDNTYINLPDKLYTRQDLNLVPSPNLVILNKPLAKELGLNIEALVSQDGIDILGGNKIPKGGEPIAQSYAGHQFGHFTILGDGRALLIGEHITPEGKRLDVQLKGSGKTLYSRGGDGRAALGPMLREYIISEALYNLKIPTSRSLAVVTTGEKILREEYLDGAVLTRVASSHIRVGTFQFISNYGSIDGLKALAEYTIERHFSYLAREKDRFQLLLREVISRQAELISRWQLVGFIHGVMNTDNMTISGESIDFGPCAFMDNYNTDTVFSSIDRHGRYAYGNQPDIGAWNLARFADTLLPLIHNNQDKAIEIASGEISNFYNIYNDFWLNGMRKKLGLFGKGSEDKSIISELLDIMQRYEADFTNTFRSLTIGELFGMEIFNTREFIQWKKKWDSRLEKQKENKEESVRLMKGNNPSAIPRNYKVEEVLESATIEGNLDPMYEFLNILGNPYAYTGEGGEYTSLPPKRSTPYKTFCGT